MNNFVSGNIFLDFLKLSIHNIVNTINDMTQTSNEKYVGGYKTVIYKQKVGGVDSVKYQNQSMLCPEFLGK